MYAKRFLLLLLVATLFRADPAVFAEESETEAYFEMSLSELLNLNVESSLGTNLVGQRLQDIPASVTVISKEEIALTGARHLGELLQLLIPGFMWVTDEDDYIYGFRGLVQDNNSTTKLLVNGQDIGFNYNQGLATQAGILDLDHIQRLEVITGPGGAELGCGPLIGVINIVTEDPHAARGVTGSISGKVGTGALYSGNATFSYRDSVLSFRLHFAGFSQKEGYEPVSDGTYEDWQASDGSALDLPAGVQDECRYFESYPGHALYLHSNYRDWKLSFYQTKTQWDPYTIPNEALQVYETIGGRLSKRFAINDKFAVDANVHSNVVGLWERIRRENPGTLAQTGEVSLGGQAGVQFSGKRIKAAVGGDAVHYSYGENPFTGKNIYRTREIVDTSTVPFPTLYNTSNSDSILPEDIPEYSQFNANITAQDFGFFGEVRLALNDIHSFLLAARLSHVDLADETGFSPRVAYVGQTDMVQWKLFYTRAFRTVIDANNDALPTGGWFRHYNIADIRPQYIDDIEMNVSLTLQKLFAELRGFYAINRDIIQGLVLTPGTELDGDSTVADRFWWTFVNSGDIHSVGLEARTELAPNAKWRFGLSHALAVPVKIELEESTEDLYLFVNPESEHFLNYPENVTRAHVTVKPWKWLDLRSDLLVDYGRRYADSEKLSDPWFNWNFGIRGRWGEHVEGSVHIFNILDSRPLWPVIFQQSTVTATPRSFSLKLKLKL